MKVFRIVMAVVVATLIGIGGLFLPVSRDRDVWETEKALPTGGEDSLRLLEKLDLNAGQEREIASILGKHQDEIGNSTSGVVEARQNLRAVITADVFSEDAVRQAAQQVSEQEVKAAVLRAQIMNEVRPVLTSEQSDRLKQFADKRTGKMNRFLDARLAGLDKWIADHTQ